MIPPEKIMTEYLDGKLLAELKGRIADRILLENNHEAQAAAAFREVVEEVGGEVLRNGPF